MNIGIKQHYLCLLCRHSRNIVTASTITATDNTPTPIPMENSDIAAEPTLSEQKIM